MKKLMLTAIVACLSLPALAADDAAPAPNAGKGLRARVRERIEQRFDRDGDGQLAPEERDAARNALVNRILQRFDKDGDGKLSREELSEALAALRGRLEQARQRHAGKGGPHAPAGPRL